MGLPNPFDVAAAKAKEDAAKKALEQAQADRAAGVTMTQTQDWSPERVRDNVGTYQRSRSPMADAFLQSLLTGDNAAAIQGTRAGAKFDKADAEERFNKNYGGWAALRAQQHELDTSTPWQIEKPAGAKTYGDETDDGTSPLTAEERRKIRDLNGGAIVDSTGKWLGTTPGNENKLNYKPILNLQYASGGKKVYEPGSPDYLARTRRFIKLLESGMEPTAAARASIDESYQFGPPDDGDA